MLRNASSSSPILTRLLIAAAIPAALTFETRPAAAETTIAGDLDYAVPINEDDVSSGAGFGIRLGQQLHVPALVVTPELGFTYAKFGDDFAPKVYRGVAGLRLGVGEIIRPGVFAHAGVGRISIDAPAGIEDPSHTGFTFDGGAFLDFTLLPLLNIGVHAAYNQLAGNDYIDSYKWATLGAHAALVF